MTAVEDIEREVGAPPSIPTGRRTWREESWHLRSLIGRLAERGGELRDAIDGRLDDLRDAIDARIDSVVAARLAETTARANADSALDARLHVVEGIGLAIHVVATSADLPISASPRDWYRVTGDPAIYVGNGGSLPLRKITTQAI
jgi:hypothetical protein